MFMQPSYLSPYTTISMPPTIMASPIATPSYPIQSYSPQPIYYTTSPSPIYSSSQSYSSPSYTTINSNKLDSSDSPSLLSSGDSWGSVSSFGSSSSTFPYINPFNSSTKIEEEVPTDDKHILIDIHKENASLLDEIEIVELIETLKESIYDLNFYIIITGVEYDTKKGENKADFYIYTDEFGGLNNLNNSVAVNESLVKKYENEDESKIGKLYKDKGNFCIIVYKKYFVIIWYLEFGIEYLINRMNSYIMKENSISADQAKQISETILSNYVANRFKIDKTFKRKKLGTLDKWDTADNLKKFVETLNSCKNLSNANPPPTSPTNNPFGTNNTFADPQFYPSSWHP